MSKTFQIPKLFCILCVTVACVDTSSHDTSHDTSYDTSHDTSHGNSTSENNHHCETKAFGCVDVSEMAWELAGMFLGLVCLAIVVEKMLHHIEHVVLHSAYPVMYAKLVNSVITEIMIMGIISFMLTGSKTLLDLSQDIIQVMDLTHACIFGTMIFYVCQAYVNFRIVEKTQKIWQTWEESPVSSFPSNSKYSSWLGWWTSEEYKIAVFNKMRANYIAYHNFPKDFPFTLYMVGCMNNVLINSVRIGPLTWTWFLFSLGSTGLVLYELQINDIIVNPEDNYLANQEFFVAFGCFLLALVTMCVCFMWHLGLVTYRASIMSVQELASSRPFHSRNRKEKSCPCCFPKHPHLELFFCKHPNFYFKMVQLSTLLLGLYFSFGVNVLIWIENKHWETVTLFILPYPIFFLLCTPSIIPLYTLARYSGPFVKLELAKLVIQGIKHVDNAKFRVSDTSVKPVAVSKDFLNRIQPKQHSQKDRTLMAKSMHLFITDDEAATDSAASEHAQ